MSKKDYELIAREMKCSKPVKVDQTEEYFYGQLGVWENHVLRFTALFADDNPRFNRAKFLQACGYND